MMNYSVWLDQLLANLDRRGPEGQAALKYLRDHQVKVGLHDQPTAARWTLVDNSNCILVTLMAHLMSLIRLA
jgi:hypothetical protein